MNQIYHCGVQCIVMRHDKVLLGKRFRTSGEGQWALPGGHVEHSESLLEAARRELLEETTLLGFEAVAGPSFTTYSTELPYVHVPVVFRGAQGQPKIPPEEKFSELRFFALRSLPEPLFQPSSTALETVSPPFTVNDLAAPRSSFVKIDFMDTRDDRDGNRGYSLILVVDGERAWIIRSWGSRDCREWNGRRDLVMNVASAISKLNTICREQIANGFLVSDVSGEISLQRLLSVFSDQSELQVVSRSLIDRLAEDSDFRDRYLRDWRRGQTKLPLTPGHETG